MNNLQQLASNLHLLLCNKPHNPDVKDLSKMSRKKKSECYWYYERQLEFRWEERDHKEWLALAVELDNKEGNKVISEVFQIKADVKAFILDYPLFKDILIRAISPMVK